MNKFLPYVQLGVTALLIVFILLQQRGQALGSAFGEGAGFYATRRGIQKRIFVATIILGAVFIALALLNLVL